MPIYLQIADDLKKQILAGKYVEGDLLPSESELTKKYGVTRTTIQRALNILVNDGIIERVHGKGTFVKLRSVRKNIWNFSGFSDYAKQVNETPVTKVITHETFFKQNERYLKLVRLRGFKRKDNVQWITLDTSVLSLKAFPGLDRIDFSTRSLYETLKTEYDTKPDNAQLSVKAILATDELMDYFGLSSPQPLLNVLGEVFDTKGNVMEQVDVVYSQDANFNFVINM